MKIVVLALACCVASSSAFAQVDSTQSTTDFGGLLGWDPQIASAPDPGGKRCLWEPAAHKQNGKPQGVTAHFGMMRWPGAYVGDTRALNAYLDLIGLRP